MYCTDLTFVNHSDTAGTINALRCKKWDCPHCRPVNRQRVMRKAAEGHPNLFMTLTCDPERYETPEEAARDMKRGLVALRRRIERKWKVKNIPFIVVYERTKKGWPHMHLLMRAPYMHWKVLRGMWNDITGAFEVDVREIKKRSSVLFYVTKYIGKDLARFEGCKRWWRSHNYAEPKKDEKPFALPFPGKSIQRTGFRTMLKNLASRGWTLEKLNANKYFAMPPDHYMAGRWRSHLAGDCIAPMWLEDDKW